MCTRLFPHDPVSLWVCEIIFSYFGLTFLCLLQGYLGELSIQLSTKVNLDSDREGRVAESPRLDRFVSL